MYKFTFLMRTGNFVLYMFKLYCLKFMFEFSSFYVTVNLLTIVAESFDTYYIKQGLND